MLQRLKRAWVALCGRDLAPASPIERLLERGQKLPAQAMGAGDVLVFDFDGADAVEADRRCRRVVDYCREAAEAEGLLIHVSVMSMHEDGDTIGLNGQSYYSSNADVADLQIRESREFTERLCEHIRREHGHG